MSFQQCIILEIPDALSQWSLNKKYDFYWVFLKVSKTLLYRVLPGVYMYVESGRPIFDL